jgi:hypothetical protein
MLLKTVQSRRIDPTLLITHRFKLDQILDAYETSGGRRRPGRSRSSRRSGVSAGYATAKESETDPPWTVAAVHGLGRPTGWSPARS